MSLHLWEDLRAERDVVFQDDNALSRPCPYEAPRGEADAIAEEDAFTVHEVGIGADAMQPKFGTVTPDFSIQGRQHLQVLVSFG